MRILEIILAAAAVFAAIYNFDWYDFNRCIVSVLLLISAYLTVSNNKKAKETVRKTALVLAVILVLKTLFVG